MTRLAGRAHAIERIVERMGAFEDGSAAQMRKQSRASGGGGPVGMNAAGPPPPPVMCKAGLGELAGVRSTDHGIAEIERRAIRRDRPRLAFGMKHALAAMLLLAAALCASLTLLVQQAVNLSQPQGDDTSYSQGVGDGGDAGNGDDGADNGNMPDGGSAADNGDTVNGGNAFDSGNAPDPGTSVSDGNVAGEDAGNGDDAGGSGAGDADSSRNVPVAPDDGLVDLNSAGAEELDGLTGVGPVIARRILDHRKAIGRFSSVDQLLDVKGIGPKTLEKMRGQVTVR